MRFEDDEKLQCKHCQSFIFAGMHYLHCEGYDFCDEDCLKEYLFYQVSFTEEYLETAEDKELNYGDMRDEY